MVQSMDFVTLLILIGTRRIYPICVIVIVIVIAFAVTGMSIILIIITIIIALTSHSWYCLQLSVAATGSCWCVTD